MQVSVVSSAQITTSNTLLVDATDRGLSLLVSEKRPALEAPQLARRWGIGIDAAKCTLKQTTQRGVRSVPHPSLSRKFRTNGRQMRYKHLPITLYSDTMFASVKSLCQNTCAMKVST